MPLLLTSTSRRRARRGAGTLLFMATLTIFLGLLMLCANYAFLAYSQLRTSDVTDTLARTAVVELLDEGLLEDDPIIDAQTNQDSLAGDDDDVAQAELAVQELLEQLNLAAAQSQQLIYDRDPATPGETDITVTPIRIDDVTRPVTDDNLEENPQAGTLYNALRVEAARPANGQNPLYLLIRGWWVSESADIGSASYAVLDSRLVGFRPSPLANAPVAPIGIEISAWNSFRLVDSNGNNRLELDGRLAPSGAAPADPFNLVMLKFTNDVAPVNPADIEEQLFEGLDENDVENGFLGPVVPNLTSLTVDAEKRSPVSVATLAQTLDDIAQSQQPRRVFPLYGSYDDSNRQATLVGFVAAQVLRSEVIMTASGDQLQVVLEPAFVVHFTAETDRTLDEDQDSNTPEVDVPENVYIHKIRLAR